MAILLKINNVDKASEIDWKSLNLQRALTNQTDTLTFTVKRANSSGYKPAILDDVKLYDVDGTTVLFGGTIITIDEDVNGMVEYCRITCKDYTFELDRTLVIDTFENQTVQSIIESIVGFPTGNFTVTNVDGTQVVKFIAFNYEQPSKCIQQLAQLFEYDWYVDADKDIHFFSKTNNPAPFNLTDTSANYIYKSLKIRNDIKNLRNSVIVRGGQYQGSTVTEKQEADGQRTTFQFAYQYANIVVKKATITQTVGIDFITDPLTVDCLYNFNEKSIKFPIAPANGTLIEVSGNPYIPVIVKVRDTVSVAENGEYQFKIIDKSINSKEGARDRAKAELKAWANTINEGSFATQTVGLDTGQLINIQSTIRGIDTDYVISRITSKLHTPTEFIHECTLVTSKTFGMIEFLQKLLMEKDKEIEIGENEVSDEVESVEETINIGESVVASLVHNPQAEAISIGESTTVQALNYGVEFVLADQPVPSGVEREFCLDGSPLG